MRRDDEEFEDEEARRREEQDRQDRRREKADVVININPGSNTLSHAERDLTARLEMACLQCGAGMIRGTQCRRCGAWCR